MTEIAGKVALVTGGGSGIGRGLVLALANEGAAVVVVDLIEERASAVVDEVKTLGGTAFALTADVSKRADVRRMKADANDALGTVSLLFANAGVTWFDRLTDMNADDVDWVIHVNLMGALYCVETFLPDMIDAGGGHVFATASIAGLIPGWVPNHTPYSISKAGIIALMLNLHQELAGTGVGSTVYCPRAVRGRIGESYQHRPTQLGKPIDRPFKVDEEWSAKNAVRTLEPEQVGPIGRRRCSDSSSGQARRAVRCGDPGRCHVPGRSKRDPASGRRGRNRKDRRRAHCDGHLNDRRVAVVALPRPALQMEMQPMERGRHLAQ